MLIVYEGDEDAAAAAAAAAAAKGRGVRGGVSGPSPQGPPGVGSFSGVGSGSVGLGVRVCVVDFCNYVEAGGRPRGP